MNGKDATILHELVSAFSLTERQLLMLHYVEGLSPLEISVILDFQEQEVIDRLESMRARTRNAMRRHNVMSPPSI